MGEAAQSPAIREHAELSPSAVPTPLRGITDGAKSRRARLRGRAFSDRLMTYRVAGFESGPCRLGVRLGHSAMSAQCPDYPKADDWVAPFDHVVDAGEQS